MPDNSTPNGKDTSKSLLDTLKQYKEFIAILVFFFTGVMWLYGFFATKEQVQISRCLANNQISLAKSDLIIELRKKDLIQNATALNKLEAKASRTPEEAAQVAQLKIDRTVLMEDLKAANARYNTAMEYLSSGGCENQ